MKDDFARLITSSGINSAVTAGHLQPQPSTFPVKWLEFGNRGGGSVTITKRRIKGINGEEEEEDGGG